MSEMLSGKVCVVTGAGRGLGRDFAVALAAAGAQVVVNDVGASLGGEGRDDGPAAEVVSEIEAQGVARRPASRMSRTSMGRSVSSRLRSSDLGGSTA